LEKEGKKSKVKRRKERRVRLGEGRKEK